ELRTRHILRLQKGNCSIEAGFVWSDLLTGLERTSDHCSNIAGCLFDMSEHNLNVHESVRVMQLANKNFGDQLEKFTEKYSLPVEA
ncbi:MAG: Na/Pi cotransporter family protein, partial [Butyricicoccus sp.]|nr:Na/Pi cotransporter family protein [Butyricicoccus sp.]